MTGPTPTTPPGRRSIALKVAIISPTFGGYGGLEAFVLRLLEGLPPSPELDVRVFFKRTAGFASSPHLTEAFAPFGARVQFVPRASLAMARAVAWADLVHVQNPCPDVVLLAKLMRRPLLVTVINHRQPGRSLRQRLWDHCLRRAQARFYISAFVRRTWEGETVRPGSRVVFPICRLAGGITPPEERRGFAFAARWIPNKGVDTLVEAYARAGLDPERWPLRLIGDGPLRPQIERLIRERAVRGVEVLGFLSEEAKAGAIRSARFMVIPPNTREDFGFTAIEARHLGVPCIITRDGGLPEAAGPDALRCEPGDIDGLAGCLREAAAMPAADYAALAERSYHSLLPTLVQPSFYAGEYRRLAQT